MVGVEEIIFKNKILAIIISHDFQKTGLHFFTPGDFSQQLAYMKHSSGKIIKAHMHNHIFRKVYNTQEVLLVRKGRLRVDFYDDNQTYLESRILVGGDIILLASGGHGFKVLKEAEIIEVKQGPYVGDNDKIRFSGVLNDQVKLNEKTNE